MRAIVPDRIFVEEHPVHFAGGCLLTRMTAIVLDEIDGDDGATGPMEEHELAHYAVAHRHPLELAGPQLVGQRQQRQIRPLPLEAGDGVRRRVGEGALRVGHEQVMAGARGDERAHLAELQDGRAQRLVDGDRRMEQDAAVVERRSPSSA